MRIGIHFASNLDTGSGNKTWVDKIFAKFTGHHDVVSNTNVTTNTVCWRNNVFAEFEIWIAILEFRYDIWIVGGFDQSQLDIFIK